MNKKEILFLSGLISENQMHEDHHDGLKHYMFFSNLRVIKSRVDSLLTMNPQMLDAMLDDGHDWANDHVATSKDDIEEVFNWATSRGPEDNAC